MHVRCLALVGMIIAVLSAAVAPASSPQDPAASQPATKPASTPASYESDEELAAMIAALADANFAVRSAAQKELLERASTRPDWGELIRQASVNHPDPEARARCLVVSQALLDQVRFGPSRISFSAEEVTAEAVVTAFLQKITETYDDVDGVGLRPERRPRFFPEGDPFNGNKRARDRIVSIDMQDVEFWEAMRIFGRTTGLWPIEHQAGFAFSQSGQPLANFPQSVHLGTNDIAAVVELTYASRQASRATTFVKDPDGAIGEAQSNGNSNVTLMLRTLLEPKIVIAGQQVRWVVTEAIDSNGKDVRNPSNAAGQAARNGNAIWSLQMRIPLNVDAANASLELESFKGYIEFEAAARIETVELDISDAIAELMELSRSADVTPGAQDNADQPDDGDEPKTTLDLALAENAGPYQLAVVQLSLPELPEHLKRQIQRQARNNPDQNGDARIAAPPQLGVVLHLATPDIADAQNEWTAGQAWVESLSLLDAKGRVWQQAQTNHEFTEGRTALRTTINYVNWQQEMGLPTKFIWSVPLERRTLRIPFEFHNIPLPKLE